MSLYLNKREMRSTLRQIIQETASIAKAANMEHFQKVGMGF